MEQNTLIQNGLDAVESLIAYLAKDAIGAQFLGEYLSSNSAQSKAADKQKQTLNHLIESSQEMEKSTSQIGLRAEKNIERLNGIYNAIASLRDSVERIELEHKRYTEQFKIVMDQTKEIKKLIDNVTNISEQTNLLSFNASIEAAHAGAAGAGFRIIANEVKKLSDDTRKSSDQIMSNMDHLITSIQKLEKETANNASSLSGLTEETEETLTKFESVRKINSSNNSDVEQISSGIAQNMQGIQAIIHDIQQAEDRSKESINLFAESASKNAMLFNDLYSFAYELKAVFEALQKQA